MNCKVTQGSALAVAGMFAAALGMSAISGSANAQGMDMKNMETWSLVKTGTCEKVATPLGTGSLKWISDRGGKYDCSEG